MTVTIRATPPPVPIPVAMSGSFAGAPLGVLPGGAMLFAPHLNAAGERRVAALPLTVDSPVSIDRTDISIDDTVYDRLITISEG